METISYRLHIFYYIMYNEHFQYPQYGATSSFPYESSSRPTPVRTEPPKSSFEVNTSTEPNAQIINKIEALFPVLK